MRKNKNEQIHIERYNADINCGLSSAQVEQRKQDKLVNNTKQRTSKSYFRIFFDNIFTFFNLIWFGIFIALLWVGSYTNLFFMAVIITNTAIAIIQEIRSKKTVEKLSMITLPKTLVVRDGNEIEVLSDEIVLDDILVLTVGNQIPTDSIILSGKVEVNESLLTGESKPVKKVENAELFAGSFITSGKCYARANKIGKESYIQSLATAAKKFKQPNSNLFRDLNKIITVIFNFDGRYEYVELDENRMCQIPPTNSSRIWFCITTEPDDVSRLSSTILSLDVEASGETNTEQVEAYQYAHASMLGLVQNLLTGNVNAKEAEFAVEAGVSRTQVSLTGDEEVAGEKNFLGTIKHNSNIVPDCKENLLQIVHRIAFNAHVHIAPCTDFG